MKNEEVLKELVKEKYGTLAHQSKEHNASSCCGISDCCKETDAIMAEDYSKLEGYVPEADLGLGCGLPTEFAQIKQGDVVVDLGSGAGNDCFIACKLVGNTGKVTGIDFTNAMIEQAKRNAEKINATNVEFKFGDIDNLPLDENYADVIISNCVLNLVPDKQKVFSEIFRVLKPEGHFSISDIVIEGELPDALKEKAEMYTGCITGAIQKNKYLQTIEAAGFVNLTIQKEKQISLPEEMVKEYVSEKELTDLKQSKIGIYSINVYAEKPGYQKN